MNTSHGEVTEYLQAGAKSHTVQAAGDFVYLKEAAFPVRVLVGGNPVTMEPGEKRRFERSMDRPGELAFAGFEVDNTSADYAQKVVFVVGSGDYEKVIVHGNLSVSSYVQTAAIGKAKSLPFDLVRTIGLQNMGETELVAGTDQWAYADTATQGAGKPWYLDGYYYAIDRNMNVYRWDDTTVNGSVETVAVATGDTFDGYTAQVTWEWNGYFYLVVDVAGVNKLKKMAPGIWQLMEIDSDFQIVTSGVNGGKGSAVRDGKIYLLTGRLDEQPGQQIAVYNPLTNAIERRFDCEDLQAYTNDAANYLSDGKNHCYLIERQSTRMWPFDPTTGRVVGPQESGPSLGYPGLITEDGLEYVQTDGSLTGWVRETFRTLTTYGEFYAQEGTDTATRKAIKLTEPVSYYVNPAGNNVLTEGAVAMTLQAVTGRDLGQPLDFVTGFTFSDGNVQRVIDSGTQSFAIRGISDRYPVEVESQVTIKLLPEFFEQ